MKQRALRSTTLGLTCFAALLACAAALSAQDTADDILRRSGVQGGLIVHLGCGDGRLTAALHAGDAYLVHGLATDAASAEQARTHVRSLGRYGRVSIDRLDGGKLPYIDNLVNLVVADDLAAAGVAPAEVMRVLCPKGVALVKADGQWQKTVKPRPAEIDEWSHYMHDATGNAVAHDTVVAPPKRLQWVGGPRWSRHHDRMSSVSAAVTAGGRVFYIFDEASRTSILLPPKWTLIARDAFNGTILWKRPIGAWHTHLWPLKSGPAQLPRRLVADGQAVYVTLDLNGPLVTLDAATGETIRTYESTTATEEAILSDGTLLALVNDAAEKVDADGRKRFGKGYGVPFYDEQPRKIVAIEADSGKLLWSSPRKALPLTLAADGQRVVFHDGESIVCLDQATGQQQWRSVEVPRVEQIRAFYAPTLVLYDGVVLFSGGETAGNQTGSWYTSGKDTLTAISASSGKVLWSAYHPPSGYRSPEDVLVIDDVVWTGETTSGRAVGVFTGRDVRTGEVKAEFPPDVETYWFHHRCYRGKATDNYLLMARTGTEFIDVDQEHWIPHHWFRGACSYGVMPANGLIYAPQHPCACYLEAKLYGFNALAPPMTGPRVPAELPAAQRLVRGPAYDQSPPAATGEAAQAWPTLRHDGARSGQASTAVPTELAAAWTTELGGKLTAPVIAEGVLLVAAVDEHTVHALDAASGKPLWQFTAGGRVDSPPSIHRGRALFGSADGWVYSLRLTDGALAWRFRAAPIDQRLTSMEQLESVWPVPGNVLIHDGVAWCVAGRSMFLDGGLRLLRLDPQSGRLLSESVLDDRDPASTDDDLHNYVSWLNMPPALPDVLSTDGKLVYMRSQPFDLAGNRLPLEAMPTTDNADAGAPEPTQNPEHAHLFCPTGLLDDSWWHRTYWMYGSRFVSGWCGYFRAGKAAPAGRILVFDDERVYGFGRKPQYYRWTTPIEHHLFAADKLARPVDAPTGGRKGPSMIQLAKSPSLNAANKPVTVEAWVHAEKNDGVVLARGGGAQGYTLVLRSGRPQFAVRSDGELSVAAAKQRVVGKWVHLTGVLTADKQIKLFIDGRLAATAKAAGLLTADPAETMQIGADDGSCVGDYAGPNGLTGLVDQLKVYHRALSDAQIARHAAGTGLDESDGAALVLAMSFDKADAADESGNANHGTIAGAAPVLGKSGRAMRFRGGPSRPPGFLVQHHWTGELPLFARALVLADGVLLAAGPDDLIDEESVFRQLNQAVGNTDLSDQAAALDGARGGVLWTVSAADGQQLSELRLDSPPVFDGMAAANGKLYLVAVDGSVVCFGGK